MAGPVIASTDPRLTQGVPPWVQALLAMSDLASTGGSVLSFPRLPRPVANPYPRTGEVRKLASLARQVREKTSERGHPFGDRDDWAGYLEQPLRDLDMGTLREMLQDLINMKGSR